MSTKYLKRELKELMKTADDVLSNAPRFTLAGQVHMAKCTKVYDGDTAHFVFKFNDEWTKFSCRMYGYNTAELRGGDNNTRTQAENEKKYLENLILNKIVKVEFGNLDKYGRPLVTVFDGDLNVNTEMVKSGNGREYYGRGYKY